MKHLTLICLLIACASAATTPKQTNKPRNGLQGRYDIPPGAELPSNGNSNTGVTEAENMSFSTGAPINLSELGDGSSNSNPFVDDNDVTNSGSRPSNPSTSSDSASNYYGNNYGNGGNGNNYPSTGTGNGYPTGSNNVGNNYPGGAGGRYPTGSNNVGNNYPGNTGGTGYPTGSNNVGNNYPGGAGGRYPTGSNNVGNNYPGNTGGTGYPTGPNNGGNNYPSNDVNNYPGGTGGSYRPNPYGPNNGVSGGNYQPPYNNNRPYGNYRPNTEYNNEGARRPNPNASDDWIPAPGENVGPVQPQPNNQPNPSNQPHTNNPQPNQPTNDPNPLPERGNNNEINDNVNEGDESCICVPYYQCQDGNIITDGAGLIDQRKRKTETPLNKRLSGPSCGEYHVCCTEPERKPLNDAYPHRCGIRNPNGINRRALSTNEPGEAEFGEWPATATILKPDQNNALYFQSGAVLISDQHVLTTAHTIQNLEPQTLIVRLGEWDVQNTNEFLPHEDYRVADIKIHDNFVPTNLRNDIAIITLAEKVKFAPNIDTICLPRENEQYGNQECVVTGWGKKDFNQGSYSNIMKKIGVPLVPHEQCQDALRKTRLGTRFRLHKSFICAGGQASKDSCKGGGGGPLYCYRPDGTYALTGLVSWGINCGTEGIPGVYTNVKEYLGFIQEHIGRDIRSLQGN